MAFTTETSKVPAAIGDIEIRIRDNIDRDDKIYYIVRILQADGSVFEVKKGDLVPHITQGQITALQDFMTTLRVKAVNEFLPGE